MKKILLLALPLMVMCFASCDNGELSGDDIIQFQDPNFLKALLCVKEMEIYNYILDEPNTYLMDVDQNKDGQISVEEAKYVIGLDVSNFNIQSMTEIKYFTDLLGCLRCDDNQLATLDVSKNFRLQDLYCDSNQLTTLDVSNNTSLRTLDCSNNQLTTLDVSNNTFLTSLYCSGNPLKTLRISFGQARDSWLDDVRRQYPDIEIIAG